jgi:hypothetical protein
LGGAVGLRADTVAPFECRAERERAAVADLAGDGAHGGVWFEQQVGRESQPPPGEERDGRFADAGVPAEEIEPLSELFTRILDGHNAHLTDDIERVLGRRPRDFADYAHDAAATGVWSKAGETEGSVR